LSKNRGNVRKREGTRKNKKVVQESRERKKKPLRKNTPRPQKIRNGSLQSKRKGGQERRREATHYKVIGKSFDEEPGSCPGVIRFTKKKKGKYPEGRVKSTRFRGRER